MEEAGDVGVDLKDKYDGKLFRRNTSNASEAWKNECQFADYVALLATTIPGAERATHQCHQVNGYFSLFFNIPKTKLIVTLRDFTKEDKGPMTINCNDIEHVSVFL